ncbi:hypothetical protein F2Q69_00054770 [Brassica cretica]|uniref:Uncharacterized protein n=1 Tax=Brassica cretica TaxID=69181 RepID=A0A8S9MXG9_BRACR|nr:hypothetical protein F2Q69_00054770 [Brassica cretica]
MKPIFALHPPSRISMPLRVESGLLSSLLDICDVVGSPGVPGKPRNYPPFIGEMVLPSAPDLSKCPPTVSDHPARFRDATVLIDIESLSLSFTFSAFTFIRCEHNDVVDALAKAALLACSSILYLY